MARFLRTSQRCLIAADTERSASPPGNESGPGWRSLLPGTGARPIKMNLAQTLVNDKINGLKQATDPEGDDR
jgi:hypothetical protein